MRRALGGFDVVHVHEPLVPMVSVGALTVSGPAKVATFHADPPVWVRRLYRYGRPAIRQALHGVHAFTAVSPVAGSAIDGMVEYRIIPNGVDVDDYATGPTIRHRVTFLGRDDPRKGLSVILEAWPRIRAAVPEAELHVIGADRAEMNGVTFLDRVAEDEKRHELAASEIHVAPNPGAESFGVVVLEAMAAGSAVVASAIPAFEYVAGGVATMVTPGDPMELASAVVELLQDPARARSMGEAARKRSMDFNGAGVSYGDVFLQSEREFSAYNFEHADIDRLRRHFTDAEAECAHLLEQGLALPAYDQCIKSSHLFNLLDARGAISVTDRAAYIGRVRALAKGCCEAWLTSRGHGG